MIFSFKDASILHLNVNCMLEKINTYEFIDLKKERNGLCPIALF
jgi:hypothetical protein